MIIENKNDLESEASEEVVDKPETIDESNTTSDIEDDADNGNVKDSSNLTDLRIIKNSIQKLEEKIDENDERTTRIEDIISEYVEKISQIEKDIKITISEKNDEINIITKANVEYILVDIETLTDDLNRVGDLTDDIGTEKQFENIRYEEKNRGINMALMAAKRHLEHAGSNAKKIEHVHDAIIITLNSLNEKLKYTEEI